MIKSPEDITSFLTFRFPLSSLKNYHYPSKLIFSGTELDFDSAKATLEGLLLESVNALLEQSDSPAVVMSAGVDSVLVAAIMKYLEPNKKIHTYTAEMHPDMEHVRAKEIADKLDTVHRNVKVFPSDYLDTKKYLSPLIEFKGEPLHSNEIALAKCEQQAKEDGCDVIFSGEGSDDIFGGYSKIFTFHHNYSLSESKEMFLDNFLNFYRYFSLEDRRKFINPGFLVDDAEILKEHFAEYEEIAIHNFGAYFIQKIHTPGLIKRGINPIRWNGLKPMFPFQNPELICFANNLPLEYKVFGKTSKYILREVAKKYIPKVAFTPKKPFKEPFDDWMSDVKTWNFNKELFIENDISNLSGWKKWMLINLNTWLGEKQ